MALHSPRAANLDAPERRRRIFESLIVAALDADRLFENTSGATRRNDLPLGCSGNWCDRAEADSNRDPSHTSNAYGPDIVTATFAGALLTGGALGRRGAGAVAAGSVTGGALLDRRWIGGLLRCHRRRGGLAGGAWRRGRLTVAPLPQRAVAPPRAARSGARPSRDAILRPPDLTRVWPEAWTAASDNQRPPRQSRRLRPRR